jgi:TonB-dependent siderophore receptor
MTQRTVKPSGCAALVAAAVSAALFGTPASAQSTPPASASGSDGLTEVVVTARYEFLSANTSGATGLPLPIEQVPQTIALVSSDFIEATNLKTLGDIASYTPGAVNAGNPENNGTVIDIRGFAAGRAVDGINMISTFNSFEPDFAIYDRLEFVEGPSSVVYGNGSPGGLVNYVTKSATRQTATYVYAQGGSWNSYRLEGQFEHSLDAANHVRFIGIAALDNGDSFTNDLNHHKFVVYGGLDADVTETVTAFIHAGYEWYSRPAFDGIPTLADGTEAPLPHSFFIGSPDIQIDTKAYFGSGGVTWKPNEVLELNLKGNYEDAGLTGGNSYGYGLEDDGTLTFNVTRFAGTQVTRNYGLGASSILHWDSLGLKDSFLSVSALYQDSKQDTNVLYPPDQGTVNVFAGQDAVYQAFNALYSGPLPYSYQSDVDAKTFTVAGQSVTKFFDKLSLLAGVSYSKPKVDTTTVGVPQNFDFGGKTSWRAGLTYEFLPKAYAYFSYSESFNPQPYLTIEGGITPPVTGKQYEAGVKYRASSRLLVTGAVYRINENNLAAYDQSVNGVDYYAALGEVTHKGGEVQVLGQLTPNWQINGGYAYLDPKITADSDPTVVGHTELFLPKNTFSLYTTYGLHGGALSGLTVGGGVRFVDSVNTSYDGSSKDIASYTITDLNLAYDLGPWKFQGVVSNLFNEKYFINNYQTLYYGNYPGAPLNFSITVRRTFQ